MLVFMEILEDVMLIEFDVGIMIIYMNMYVIYRFCLKSFILKKIWEYKVFVLFFFIKLMLSIFIKNYKYWNKIWIEVIENNVNCEEFL